jgi:cell wall-associated NlpC family hydrolase
LSERVSCAVAVAPIRAAPDDTAEQVTQALRGEPLTVEERREGWARVRTAYGYPGWIRDDALGRPADREWIVPRDGDPLTEARAYLGAPYEWGGMSERGIDCSGLVHMAFRRLGRLIPRDAHQQEAAGTPIPLSGAVRGDLITYGDADGEADHIAFWIGDGLILHATGREGVRSVVEEPEPHNLAARRRRTLRMS